MLSQRRPNADGAQLDAKAPATSTRMFHRRKPSNVQVHQLFTSPQQGSFTLTLSGTATLNTMFWRLIGSSRSTFPPAARWCGA